MSIPRSLTHSFLLRCWQEPTAEQGGEWRFFLQEIGEEGRQWRFRDVEALVAFLRAMVQSSEEDDERAGAPK